MTPGEGLRALAVIGLAGWVVIGGGFLKAPERGAAAEAPRRVETIAQPAQPVPGVWRTTRPAVGCRNADGFDAWNLALRVEPSATVEVLLRFGACAISQPGMTWQRGAPTGSPLLVTLCRDDRAQPGGCYLFFSDVVQAPSLLSQPQPQPPRPGEGGPKPALRRS